MRFAVILCALALLGATSAAVWLWHIRPDCFEQLERTVRGPAGYDVQIVDQICDSEVELVYLRPGDSEARSLVFSYYRMAASPMFQREDVAPTVRWRDRTHLIIEIDMVEQIIRQETVMDGIQIQYRVGRVLYASVD